LDLSVDQGGKHVREYAGHTGSVQSGAVDPRGRFVATAGTAHLATGAIGELRLWDLRPGRPPLTVLGSTYPDNDIGLSPDGRLLVTAGQEAGRAVVRVVSAATGTEVHRYRLPADRSGWILHATFSPDGRYVAAALGNDGAVVLRTDDWSAQYRIPPQEEKRGLRIRVAVSPDGRHLAVCGSLGWVELHDLIDRRVVWQSSVPEGSESHCVAFDATGRRVAFCPSSGPTQIRRVSDGAVEAAIPFPGAFTAEFNPDGRSIAVCGAEGLAVYDSSDGRLLMTLLERGEHEVHTCRYTADGTRLLSASRDGRVVLWDAATGQEILNLRPFQGGEPETVVLTASITPDGRRIAVNARNGLVRVIDVPSPEPVADLDVGELVRVRFHVLRTRPAVLAALMTEPALTPRVRAAAVALAEREPEPPKRDDE
jgi:WD40 repeat protein